MGGEPLGEDFSKGKWRFYGRILSETTFEFEEFVFCSQRKRDDFVKQLHVLTNKAWSYSEDRTMAIHRTSMTKIRVTYKGPRPDEGPEVPNQWGS